MVGALAGTHAASWRFSVATNKKAEWKGRLEQANTQIQSILKIPINVQFPGKTQYKYVQYTEQAEISAFQNSVS